MLVNTVRRMRSHRIHKTRTKQRVWLTFWGGVAVTKCVAEEFVAEIWETGIHRG